MERVLLATSLTVFVGAVLFVLCSQLLSLTDCFKPCERRTRIAQVMPDWRFFAPKPVTGGRHVLISPNGSTWVEVWSAQPGRWWRVLWNPPRRSSAALYQIEAFIINDILAGRNILDSQGYAVLTNVLRKLGEVHGLTCQRGAVVMSLNNSFEQDPVFQLVIASDLPSPGVGCVDRSST
jgi:hypothetical protein